MKTLLAGLFGLTLLGCHQSPEEQQQATTTQIIQVAAPGEDPACIVVTHRRGYTGNDVIPVPCSWHGKKVTVTYTEWTMLP